MSGALPGLVEIVEVSPRDGLQNEKQLVGTDAKVALIETAIRAGLKRIEATSFVNPKRVPQMADAEEVMARVDRGAGISYSGLVLNRRGADRAIAAGCDEITYVAVASETMGVRNQGRGVDQILADLGDVAVATREAGRVLSVTIAVAFGCPFEGRVSGRAVSDIIARVLEHGPDEIGLADTIGVGVPSQVTDLFGRLAEAAPSLPRRAHFHNTRNTGFANVYAALQAGVSIFDASAGGLGGCPFAPRATGNIATEDLVYMLDGLGISSGVDLALVSALDPWLAETVGHPVPGALGKAGPFP
ncbi:hydroxymethylglutaryl-CoA lyase [Acuticoccus sp. I52.16.1]|uniref:hydroxymethylglutaryl-CoA lyase n=1 Tax=Acuticoccus sp. I52.16.1 TaxID=2928472 RepID=UPI001FD5F95A|nr:hydroxymethylglutaryl-CoA lyase [Acuticoccus sp. I52.16.1]UOM32975.1 hydroxymethylglutaryl-CoA lyase [Acuticoccus sp. I52.16.1]